MTELKINIDQLRPQIIAITECNPKATRFEITKNIFHIDGYDLFISHKPKGRGVIIYTMKELRAAEVEMESRLLESVWISINLDKNDKLMIGCIYRSPSLGIGCIKEIKKNFSMSKSYGCSHICILGDFNYKEINWISSECTADFNHPANKFLDVVNDNFLTQHVHSPTRFREMKPHHY